MEPALAVYTFRFTNLKNSIPRLDIAGKQGQDFFEVLHHGLEQRKNAIVSFKEQERAGSITKYRLESVDPDISSRTVAGTIARLQCGKEKRIIDSSDQHKFTQTVSDFDELPFHFLFFVGTGPFGIFVTHRDGLLGITTPVKELLNNIVKDDMPLPVQIGAFLPSRLVREIQEANAVKKIEVDFQPVAHGKTDPGILSLPPVRRTLLLRAPRNKFIPRAAEQIAEFARGYTSNQAISEAGSIMNGSLITDIKVTVQTSRDNQRTWVIGRNAHDSKYPVTPMEAPEYIEGHVSFDSFRREAAILASECHDELLSYRNP